MCGAVNRDVRICLLPLLIIDFPSRIADDGATNISSMQQETPDKIEIQFVLYSVVNACCWKYGKNFSQSHILNARLPIIIRASDAVTD